MSDIQSYKLAGGGTIPGIGFGLWKNTDEAECKKSIQLALQAGYRHFDTAQAYHNEQWLGDVLAGTFKAGNVKRQDVFVTTKIAVQHFGRKRAVRSFDESFRKLQLEYIDLVLLHFPVPLLRARTWRAAEEILASGRARHIGVSNYTVRHLEALLSSCKVKPAINQVELHVFLQQPELLAYCRQHDIVVEAYSPLAHGRGLDNPLPADIGRKYGKSATQVMLRWCVEQGTVPLPKSVHKDRIEQNFDLFDFTFDDVDKAKLASLEQNLRTCWDPTRVP